MKRDPAAQLVAQMLEATTLFDGSDGEHWRSVKRWREAHTGKGATASPNMVKTFGRLLAELMSTVAPDATVDQIARLDLFRQWRVKKSAFPPAKPDDFPA